MPRTVAIIQGRMGSSRLPGKVLLDVGGQPMLLRVIERTRRADLLDATVVATTTELQDDPVAGFCEHHNIPVYRGSVHDVLDRFYQAARMFEAQTVVRITGDCPVIDPGLINALLSEFQQTQADFAANRLPPPWRRTFPIGLDVEIVRFPALERAWKEADQKFQREHVMPFFYDDIPLDRFDMTGNSLVVSPRGFRTLLVNHQPDYGFHRWTVDTSADLELIRRVYAYFGGADDFSWKDVLAIFARDPELARTNADVVHKSAYDVDTRQKGN